MFREKTSILQLSILISDLIITGISFFIAYWLRATILMPLLGEGGLYPLFTSLKGLLLLLPLWWILYLRFGRYQPVKVLGRYTFPLLPVFKANVVGMLIAIAVAYFLKIGSISRAFVLLFFMVNCMLLLIWRIFLLFFQKLFFKEKNYRHVLIIGDKRGVAKLKGFIEQSDEWGIKIVEIMEKCSTDQLTQCLQNKVIDNVIFILGNTKLAEIENDISVCEQMGVSIHLITDWFLNRAGKTHMEDFYGSSMITFDAVKRKAWEHVVKRMMDFILAFGMMLFFLPAMAAIATIIKLTSAGPVFFTQIRGGLNGRHIKLYKFRSMIAGAENMQEALKDKNEMSGPVFKIKNDPRLTHIGKFMRRTSLDELPQLWNVIKGDISLVGPRPLPEYEVKKLKPWQRRRLSVMPGITCLWQISGRNDIDFDQWMKAMDEA